MKLPKYWNNTNAASDGLAPGVSKSNSLEIVNAPFLTASGPGFTTYKKDGFTNIVLEGGSSTRPYLWAMVMRSEGGGGSGKPVFGYNMLCEPETGTAIEFVTNVNNRGELLDPHNPSKKAPLRRVFTEATARYDIGVSQFCVRVGGGWMLGTSGDGKYSWPVLFTFEDVSKNFLACTNVQEQVTTVEPGRRRTFAFTSLSALGWDHGAAAYAWAAGYTTETNNLADDVWAKKVFHKVRITTRVEGPHALPCNDTYDYFPVIQHVVEEDNEIWANTVLECGVFAGDTKGNAAKVTYYNSVDENKALGRAYPPETTGGKAFCVGPGRMMSVILRMGGGQVPGTWVKTDPVVVHTGTQNAGGTCPYESFNAADSYSFGDGTYTPEFRAGTKIEFDSYPAVDSLVFFSEDFGRTWARRSFDAVFPGVLATEGPTSAFRHSQVVRMGPYYWACYIGEGKSLVFLPAADYPFWYAQNSGDVVGYLQEPDVACFLLEGTRATRLKWPGDTPGTIACAVGGGSYSALDMPATLGVGAYSCMTTTGELCITLDFGQTWTTTKNAMPNATVSSPASAPVVPIVRSPAVAAHVDPLGHPIAAVHARTMTIIPGEAIAQPAGSVQKLRVYEVTALSSNETFAELLTNGAVRAPGLTPLYPPLSDSSISPKYCVYYGEPSNRERPRPELGDEFAKPKKPT